MVIIYLGDGSRKILEILDEMNCDYKLVGDSQKEMTMDELLDVNRFSRSRGRCFMYFIDFTEDLFNQFDQRMTEEGLELPLMAVQTDLNRQWTLSAVMDAVEFEYELYSRRDELIDLVANVDAEQLKLDVQYLQLIQETYTLLLQQEEVSIEMYTNQIQLIKNYGAENEEVMAE